MTDPITVPQTTPLARIPNIELLHTGTWQLSTGVATFTTDDLLDAVTALGCPAVRRPILKLGHQDPRFDGEPCVGWVDGLAVADNGRTLVGDYAGMPGWLGEVLASAYPDRSIEGSYDHRCQIGHIHPFVVTAVALLGVTAPGVGTLESLQDVATLYGVAAKSDRTGTPVSVRVRGSSVPKIVVAGVSSEDVMRAFYSSELGKGWDSWVEELQLDPLQLIYVNDKDNSRARVPVVVGDGDGSDAVSFGESVPVIIRYVDAAAALPGSDNVIRCSYRQRPTDPQAAVPAAPSADESAKDRPSKEAQAPVDFSEDQLAKIRSALGLPDDADPDAIATAAVEKLAASLEPPSTPPVVPDGTVVVDRTQFDDLVTAAKAGAEARAQQEREHREGLVSAAVHDGRIAPARREAWLKQLEADAGAADVLAALSPGLIPVGPEIGHEGGVETTAEDALYAKLWGAPAGANGP